MDAVTEQSGSVLCHRSNSYLSLSLSITYVGNRKIGAPGSNVILLYLLMNRTKGSIKSILLDIVMQIKYIGEKGNHFVALTTDHESDWVWFRMSHWTVAYEILYIYEILCGMDSYDKWNAPSCVLCALHSHLSSRLHLFITTLISFKTVFHTDQHWKRKNPQMGPWCQFEDWHLTTLLQRKANRGLAQNRKSPTARKTLCACMNSCLSRFGHPERKHGPGQPEIFPRDSYHLSAKSRLNNRPGAGPETLIYLVRKRP